MRPKWYPIPDIVHFLRPGAHRPPVKSGALNREWGGHLGRRLNGNYAELLERQDGSINYKDKLNSVITYRAQRVNCLFQRQNNTFLPCQREREGEFVCVCVCVRDGVCECTCVRASQALQDSCSSAHPTLSKQRLYQRPVSVSVRQTVTTTSRQCRNGSRAFRKQMFTLGAHC